MAKPDTGILCVWFGEYICLSLVSPELEGGWASKEESWLSPGCSRPKLLPLQRLWFGFPEWLL